MPTKSVWVDCTPCIPLGGLTLADINLHCRVVKISQKASIASMKGLTDCTRLPLQLYELYPPGLAGKGFDAYKCIQNLGLHSATYTSPSSVATSKQTLGFPPAAMKAWQSPLMQANTAPLTKHAGRTYATVDSWETYRKMQATDPTSSFLEMMNSQKVRL